MVRGLELILASVAGLAFVVLPSAVTCKPATVLLDPMTALERRR